MTDENPLSRAFTKARQKAALTPQEGQALRDYNRRRAQLRTDVYWVDEQEKLAMKTRAQSDGAPSLADWIRSMVTRGMHQANRTQEEWQRLEAKIQQAEGRLAQQMDIAHEQMQKASRYERERRCPQPPGTGGEAPGPSRGSLSMADNPFFKRGAPVQDDGKPKRFQSNDDIFEAYLKHVKKVDATSTYAAAYYQLRKFMEYWQGRLILDLPRAELTAYIDVYEAVCTNFRRGGLKSPGQSERPNSCKLKLPMNCQNCPSYEGMKAVTTEHHLNKVAGLFDWLLRNQQITHDEWAVVMRSWREDNLRRATKEISARRYGRRFLSLPEMVLLIEGCRTWTWKITCLLGAKYFLRASELARLKASPKYLDPDLNWIMIPLAGGNDGKRIVEEPYPIDEETRRYLQAYLRWRRAKLLRCGQDPDAVEGLIITKNGRPFSQRRHVGASFTHGIVRNAKAVGIKRADEIGSHVLRRFASDRCQSLGIHGNELKLVRGDWVESEATGAYLNTKRLPELHAKACPPLGLRPPPGDMPMEGKREGFQGQETAAAAG